MELEQARNKLMEVQEKLFAYAHAMGLIEYDGATAAPKGTAGNRARTLGVLSQEWYRLSTGTEMRELLSFLETCTDRLSEKENRMVFLLSKDLKSMEKIPEKEYVEYRQLLVEADDVWHRAKENSDFELFRPCLEKIFETNRRFAGYCAPEMDAYDYWLDQYEPGLNREVCDAFFEALRVRLVPLIEKICTLPQVDDSCLIGPAAIEKQAVLSEKLMKLIGLDPDHVGLSTTEHPFTTSLGSHLDERITTHYQPELLASSMYSVIHEGGHALYDTGSADELAFTVLDGGVSMGIHESQSRFYENILGRSRAFCKNLYPVLKELFPERIGDASAEDLYRAVNKVQPSLIRTEADEVTYCLHVMVRYELEKRVMAGQLEVKDLPGEWNRLYKEYLGVDVPNDREGVLQDSHWSGGVVGYFPSYALGSAYGAQFFRKMKESVDVEACLKDGDFGPINEWNRQNIWQYGSLYTPAQLLQRVLSEPFDPGVYLDYLEEKCREVYGIG